MSWQKALQYKSDTWKAWNEFESNNYRYGYMGFVDTLIHNFDWRGAVICFQAIFHEYTVQTETNFQSTFYRVISSKTREPMDQ